jgi:hypothetical protein
MFRKGTAGQRVSHEQPCADLLPRLLQLLLGRGENVYLD